MDESWIYYKLQHKKYKKVELIGCINLETIDDDEPDVEWMQNDGTWGNHMPSCCKINNIDYTPILDELKETLSYESDVINQFIFDCHDVQKSFREFNNCVLCCSANKDKVIK